jgi:site-specific DNA-adenine methylase
MKTKGVRKTPVTGLIRYPGGKSKLWKVITTRLQEMVTDLGPNAEFQEPFLGSGSVVLAALSLDPRVRRAWINDRDPAMAAL